MLYTTNKQTLMGLDSRRYSLQSPLIRAPGRPAGGWRASLPVKGQVMQVGGNTPVEVFNAAVVLLRRNNVEVSHTDIWLNLNQQWMSRTPEKYHLVPIGDLMTISKAKELEEKDKDTRKRSYKPSDWGHLAWGWLNIFLAREEFHFRDFLTQLAYVLDLLNPSTNPEIGCAECYRDFLISVERVKKMPGMTREEARQWIVDTHNEVNKKLEKKVLTYAEASKAAFWT